MEDKDQVESQEGEETNVPDELSDDELDEVSGGGGCIRFPDSLGCSGR